MTSDELKTKMVRALVKAFQELNLIRARDGAPRGVDEAYFSSVVDDIDEAVKAATGHTAHCHPELYRTSGDAK